MIKKPVVVIGDIILDEYWHGISERISPEAPVPVVLKKKSISRLGGAANVALNITTLEQQAFLIGMIGCDEAAIKIKHLLAEGHIQNALIEELALTTIQKLRILANNHYIGRVDFEEAFATDTDKIISLLPQEADWCVLSDYGKGTLTHQDSSPQATQKLIKFLKNQNTKVCVDPKATFEHYRGAWLIKPNQKEFETYVGAFKDLDDLKVQALEALKHFEFEHMLITLGAQGMLLVNSDQTSQYWASEALDVFDVTGAGDTVIATLASFMAQGAELPEAVAKANHAAAIAVSKKGVYNVKLQELT